MPAKRQDGFELRKNTRLESVSRSLRKIHRELWDWNGAIAVTLTKPAIVRPGGEKLGGERNPRPRICYG